MAKIISTFKAILTRLLFSAHSLLAIWQVTENMGDAIYWSLCSPLILLFLEGVFTLMIKKNQEWRWFCPSVFLYLGSVVPAIWLLELDKVERRSLTLATSENVANNQSIDGSPLETIDNLLGETGIKMPRINEDTLTMLIEQFLMLILIIGRWMLPKGDLTRDQLSQLLLVYIGTAADIMEFFDSYKDDSIASIPQLVYLILGIWSWSLLQFTIVLSATRARRSRGSGTHKSVDVAGCCDNCCCGIDVWGIVLNVILQDAPFLTFRLLIIFQYKIINYMNVFFTCKNSLVIILQLYRLYVVIAEFWKNRRQLKIEMRRAAMHRHNRARRNEGNDANNIYTIYSEQDAEAAAAGDGRGGTEMRRKTKRAIDERQSYKKKPAKKDKHSSKHKIHTRKDTGYSTASSQNLYATRYTSVEGGSLGSKNHFKNKKMKKAKKDSNCSIGDDRKRNKRDHSSRKKSKRIEPVIEETSTTHSDSSNSSYEVINENKSKGQKRSSTTSSSSSTSSSENSQSSGCSS